MRIGFEVSAKAARLIGRENIADAHVDPAVLRRGDGGAVACL